MKTSRIVLVVLLSCVALFLIAAATFVAAPAILADISGTPEGVSILYQIRWICGDHPVECPVGQFIARLHGKEFAFESVNGIAKYVGGDGFSLYSLDGSHTVNIVYSHSSKNSWSVEGDKPYKNWLNVRVDNYGLYDHGCFQSGCESSASLEYVSIDKCQGWWYWWARCHKPPRWTEP